MSTNPVYDITDTTKNQEQLASRVPETGRVIKEDYSIVNFADLFYLVDGDLTLRTTGGSGGITGPGTSTDSAIALWSGVAGDTLKDSNIIVDGNLTIPWTVTDPVNYLGNDLAVTVDATASGSGIASGYNSTVTWDNNFDTTGGIQGGILAAVHNGTGTVGIAQGAAIAVNNLSTGTITSANILSLSNSNAGGTVTTLTGIKFNAPNGTTNFAFDFKGDYVTGGNVVNVADDGLARFLPLSTSASGLYWPGSSLILSSAGNINMAVNAEMISFDVTGSAGGQFRDNIPCYFGTSATADSRLIWDTGQTNDALMMGLGQTSRTLIVVDSADITTNYTHSNQTNPTIFVHSADSTNVNDWLSLTHDQTSGVIGSGNGGVAISPDSYAGAPGSTGAFFQANGNTYTDNVTAASGTTFAQNFHSFSAGTLAATNTGVTTVIGSTLGITDLPVAGTNQTVSLATGLIVGDINGFNSSSNEAIGQVLLVPGIDDGASNVGERRGMLITGTVGGTSLGNQTADLSGIAGIKIDTITFTSTTNTRTVTGTVASLQIASAPSAGTNVVFSQEAYALFVESGLSQFDGQVEIAGGLRQGLTTVTSGTHNATTSELVIDVTYTGTGVVTVNLPTAVGNGGLTYIIKDGGGNASVNNITVDGNGTETIDGSTTYAMATDWMSLTIISDGSNWLII